MGLESFTWRRVEMDEIILWKLNSDKNEEKVAKIV